MVARGADVASYLGKVDRGAVHKEIAA